MDNENYEAEKLDSFARAIYCAMYDVTDGPLDGMEAEQAPPFDMAKKLGLGCYERAMQAAREVSYLIPF